MCVCVHECESMMCPVVHLWEKEVCCRLISPLIDYSSGSLSWLGSRVTVSAAISGWTRTHRTCTQMHTPTAGEDGEVMGEGARLIAAMSSLGSWNSSLINRPKYHLIYHGEGRTEGEVVWGRLIGDSEGNHGGRLFPSDQWHWQKSKVDT